MRMSAKAEYAVRAMVELATVDDGVLVTTDELANAQGIPPQFLVDILTVLRGDRLVRSHRGATAARNEPVQEPKSALQTCCAASTAHWPACATWGSAICPTPVRLRR